VAGAKRLAALSLLVAKGPCSRTLFVFGFKGDDFATDNGFPPQIKKSAFAFLTVMMCARSSGCIRTSRTTSSDLQKALKGQQYAIGRFYLA
jgi:hypothetical protein